MVALTLCACLCGRSCLVRQDPWLHLDIPILYNMDIVLVLLYKKVWLPILSHVCYEFG
jgi:hypothetical protein